MSYLKSPLNTIELILMPILAAVMFNSPTDRRFTSYRFYNTHPGTQSVNRLDYVYWDETKVYCVAYNNSYCRAIWSQNAGPSIGNPPSSTAVLVYTVLGGAVFDDGTGVK